MKSKAAKKPADEDEAKSKKIRSSRGKRRRDHHSRSRTPSSSGSDSPPRKRSKKPSKKVVDKKSKKNKGGSTSRRRRRSPSPSTSPSSSPSSVSRSRSHSRRSRHSSISASERSVSPLPRSHSKDTRKGKGKGRGRGRDKDRKTRRARRSRSYSSSPASSDSSQSRSRSKSESRKRRVGGTRDYATGDRIVQDYDNYLSSRTERRNSVEDVDRDDVAVAFATKGIDDYENNVVLERRESSPSKDSREMGEILSPNDANTMDEILPVGGSPEVEEDLELILRQKALENFRKFKKAAVMPGKPDGNGTGKGVLTDSLQNTSTKIAEARSAVIPSQMHGNSFGVGHSAGSPELEDSGNGTSPWNQEMSCGDRSPGILEASAPSQQQGRRLELIRPTSRGMSQDGRNGGSVMQRLGNNLASSATAKQRLGNSTGVTSVQATRRIRSVVSIPVREGLDGSEFTRTPSACENPIHVESSSEVGDHPAEINHLEGTSGNDRGTCEASAPDSSVLSAVEGKSKGGTEDKDGSQFEKRTFSRMHDGETVQVSYKVYIPTTSPRLARRKLQR